MVSDGDFQPVTAEDDGVFAYARTLPGETLLVVCNFYGEDYTWQADRTLDGFQVLLGNYPAAAPTGQSIALRPYEALVLYRKGAQA